MPELPDVRPGQVWADNDPRNKGRLLRIESVHAADDHRPEPYARVTVQKVSRNVTRTEVGEKRTILLRRLRPTRNGYRLVEAAPEPEVREAYPEGQQPTGDRLASAWNWGGVDMSPSSHPHPDAAD